MLRLSGKNLQLRAIEPSDLDIIYKWENDPEYWFISNTNAPFSKYILQKYIENAHQDIYEARQLRLMIDLIPSADKKEDSFGTVDIFDFEPMHRRAGIGILIAKKEERMKGYASEALKLLIDYTFQSLHLHQIYCNIAVTNEPSLRLFTKLGFEVVGEKKDWLKNHQEWTNVYLLQLINKD